MAELHLAPMESLFADIVWENAPMTTRQLIDICAERLNWARTTTYTVLKKTCLRGIFQMEDRMVTVLIPKEDFNAIQGTQFVEDRYHGSLPAFISAFTARKALTPKEVEEIRKMIDSFDEVSR